jgi:hypothetical protein
MEFPYCTPCSERASSFKTKQILTVVVAVVASLVVGGLVLAIAALPLVVALLLALVLGIGATIGAVFGMKPPQPAAPATARGEGVRIVNFKGIERTTLYCTNPQWGEEFARANNVQAQTKSKGDNFGLAAIIAAVILAPGAGFGAWFLAHPSVYVDNPSNDALNVYVDGKKVMTVAANQHDSISVGRGKHTFGWSKADATAPTATTDGEVKMADAHLYNPNKTGCYWLKAKAYGDATVAGIQRGPQPVQEFYRFDKVDNWFAENPQSITVQEDETGGTQVALQRASICMDLARKGCSADVRQQLVVCQKAAGTSDDAFNTCTKTAAASCGGAAPSSPDAARGASRKRIEVSRAVEARSASASQEALALAAIFEIRNETARAHVQREPFSFRGCVRRKTIFQRNGRTPGVCAPPLLNYPDF